MQGLAVKFCVLGVFWASLTVLHAQSISGIITSTSGDPVSEATIRVENNGVGAISTKHGTYSILTLQPGSYTIITSHINFENDTVTVTLTGNQHLKLNRQLSAKTASLKEVEIVAKTESREISERPFEVNIIDVQPLQQRNLDLNRILTQSSGVRVRQNAGLGSSFDLTLNGFKAAQYINGIPVEFYGSAYAFNSIPVSQIARIEVYKGVVPVHLGGDALGGAVNIITRNKLKNNLNVSYSYGSFNTHKASVQGVYNHAATGLTFIGSAFLNHSDNAYRMKDMEVITGTTTVKKDVRRFHDMFRSYAAKAEIGYANKSFADALFIGTAMSGVRKDIQTGSTQYPPIGEATGEEDNNQLSLRYSKHGLINDRFDIDAFLLLNHTHTIFMDTAGRTYQWDGTVLTQRPPTSNVGEFEDKQIYKTRQCDLTQRYNLSYHIAANQSLTLNVITSNTHWNNTDAGKIEGTSLDDNKNRYTKFMAGLGHDMKLLEERFQSTAFIKYYQMRARIDSAARWRGGYFDRAPLAAKKSFTGAGVGFSFAFSKRFLAKASAEYACRLPSVYELLGDGITTVANVALQPELSMNYNLGFASKLMDKENTTLSFNGGVFYRQAEDFIRATTGVRRSTFINFNAALVRGVESEAKLSIAKKLSVRVNATYQQVLDDNEFTGGSVKNYSYRVQLPNTPSLFANGDMEYRFHRFLHENLSLTPYYNVLYVREFYLGYENIAKGDLKYVIPMQLVHDLGFTLSNNVERYSFSFETSNFTDALAFDNFRLQRPGRAFNVKVTYNLN